MHQIAFEPTTAMADDLVQAEGCGQLRKLPHGQPHRWSVTVSLTGPAVCETFHADHRVGNLCCRANLAVFKVGNRRGTVGLRPSGVRGA